MKTNKLSYDYPFIASRQSVFKTEEDMKVFFRDFINSVRDAHLEFKKITNAQAIEYFNQNSVPTTAQLPDGKIALWKDADAGGGASTHYLVINDAGTIVTFASEETV